MTTADLCRVIARVLRAAADEADTIAAEETKPRRQAEIRPSGTPVSELAQARADAALRRCGILLDK